MTKILQIKLTETQIETECDQRNVDDAEECGEVETPVELRSGRKGCRSRYIKYNSSS